MVLLGFSHFREKLEDGTKAQTIRRVGPVWQKVLNLFEMYGSDYYCLLNAFWKPRVKSEHAFLFDVPLLSITPIILSDVTEEIAVADGFEATVMGETHFSALYHFHKGFSQMHGKEYRAEKYCIIKWDPAQRRMPVEVTPELRMDVIALFETTKNYQVISLKTGLRKQQISQIAKELKVEG